MARTNKEDRKTRTPLGVQRQKLTVANAPEGKVLRWVNDDPGRVQSALSAGYEFLDQDGNITIGTTGTENQAVDSRFSRHVKVDERGNPVRAFLMAIDRDLYEEDQAAKMAELDKTDQAILGGAHATEGLGKNAYVPSEGISMKRKANG